MSVTLHTTAGDLKMEMRDAAPLALTVANGQWEFTLAPGTYRTVSGARERRVDVGVEARTDP